MNITANIECLNGRVLTVDEQPGGDVVLGVRDVQTRVYTKERHDKYKDDFITIPKERRALLADLLIGNNHQ
jgi:hypothetical protein